MSTAQLVSATEWPLDPAVVVVDCRFSLADADAGRRQYLQGHIPGAHYLDLNRDLSARPQQRGGRHPLPAPDTFAATLVALGIGPDSDVVAYDDSRLAFAARLWWMMRSLGYRPPRLLAGGYQAWLDHAGPGDTELPEAVPVTPPQGLAYKGLCDIDGVREAQHRGALLVDSREARRYQGLEEPIDPVAGHIPGAVNRPWQGVTTDSGDIPGREGLEQHLGDVLQAEEIVVYCGSGVTACVNLFALALAGREEATLYAGSWSDWCSYL